MAFHSVQMFEDTTLIIAGTPYTPFPPDATQKKKRNTKDTKPFRPPSPRLPRVRPHKRLSLPHPLHPPCTETRQDAASPNLGDATSCRVPSSFLPPATVRIQLRMPLQHLVQGPQNVARRRPLQRQRYRQEGGLHILPLDLELQLRGRFMRGRAWGGRERRRRGCRGECRR